MKHHKFASAAVVLAGVNAAREFLEPIFSSRDQEIMIVAYCDVRLRLVQLGLFHGGKQGVDVPLRDVFRDAIDYSAIIVGHNHPSGDPRPSEADRALTRRLSLVCESLEVSLLDHLIFAKDGMFSFRQAGYL